MRSGRGWASPSSPWWAGWSLASGCSPPNCLSSGCSSPGWCWSVWHRVEPRGGIHPDPPVMEQQLQGPKIALVAHSRAVPNPVAEVDVVQAQLTGPLHLPEDGVGAQAADGVLGSGVIEGVDGRQPPVEQIDDRHRQQAVLQIEAHIAGGLPLAAEKIVELLAGGRVHVAVAVASAEIAVVEPIVFGCLQILHQAASQGR